MKKLLFVFIATLFAVNILYAESENQTFSDVPSNHENYEAIRYMQKSGIVKGYDDGTFRPDEKINRAEFLKIALESVDDFSLIKAKKCVIDGKYSKITDLNASDWFTSYVCYALEHNIVKGYPDGTFKPSNEINLPEMAKMIANTQALYVDGEEVSEDWFDTYIRALEINNAIPTSIEKIDNKITRAEMAESLYRIKENKTDKPTKKMVDLKYPIEINGDGLGKIQSCPHLAAVMKSSPAYSQFSTRNDMMMKTMATDDFSNASDEVMEKDVAADTEAPQAAGTDTGASVSEEYSSTNIQVAGVDEADIIKNDGKYIYVIKDNSVRIVQAYPVENMKEVASFTVDDENFNPTEMFLNGDQLIVIGNSYRQETNPSILKKSFTNNWYPRYWGTNLTKVYIVDLSDHAKPIISRKVSFEGNYSNSRRIENTAYIIMNQTPEYNILRDLKLDAKEIVPQIEDSAVKDEKSKPLCGCADIDYFPGYVDPNYLIVAAIPLDDNTKEITKKVFLGASDNVYMSKQALYVATPAKDPNEWYWSYDNTQIYKFDINKLDINFKGTTKIPGGILNQFSMDENKDYFRIATTKGEVWGSEKEEKSSNRLYILDKDLKQVGAITNIAPGERIYSVRFMGDRAYMVTFKTVDPLFIIDTSDPTNPKILGYLKIPGWSDYLHPYDENHLIGFGKDVNEDIDKDKVHSEDAVYYTAVQGMKISLFDVTDTSNPKEMFTEVIGDRGTESELLYNHKALLFDKEKKLLAFPITVQKKIESNEIKCGTYLYSTCPSGCIQQCIPSSCDEYGVCTEDCDGKGSCQRSQYESFETTFVGAYVYNIDLETGFKLRGKIDAISSEELKNQGEYGYIPWQKQINRIIYIAKNLYAISQSFIKATDIETVKPSNEIEFSEQQ